MLTIFNIEVNDAGTYRCTAGSQQLHIGLTVTGMYSRQDKYIPMTTTPRRLISDICVNCSSWHNCGCVTLRPIQVYISFHFNDYIMIIKYGINIPHVELFIDCITATFKVEIVSSVFILKKTKMHCISIEQ